MEIWKQVIWVQRRTAKVEASNKTSQGSILDLKCGQIRQFFNFIAIFEGLFRIFNLLSIFFKAIGQVFNVLNGQLLTNNVALLTEIIRKRGQKRPIVTPQHIYIKNI